MNSTPGRNLGESVAHQGVRKATPHSNEKSKELPNTSDSTYDTPSRSDNEAVSTYNIDILPEEVWEKIDEHLILMDPPAVVRLNASCKKFRNLDAIRSDSIDLSCVYEMSKLRAHLVEESSDPYPFKKTFVQDKLDAVSSLSKRYRRIPLARIVRLVNYDKSDDDQNIVTATHVRVFSEMKKLYKVDVGEVMQPLLESMRFHDRNNRSYFLTKLLDYAEAANLPQKHALYSSAAHGLLSLTRGEIPTLYYRLKCLILSLPISDQIQPLAHLVRVLSKLDSESAREELSCYKQLIDIKNVPESIYILHGLLRSPQKFSNEEQLKLLDDANSALANAHPVKHIFSNVVARVEFIKAMSPELRARALDESIDALTSLRIPQGMYQNDIHAWQFETLLPLAGTLEHCPDTDEAGLVAIKFFRHMRFKLPGRDIDFTYFDRIYEPNIGFDRAKEELFSLHATSLYREIPSE